MSTIKTKFISDLAITTAKIAAAAVTGAKIESNAALAGAPTTTTATLGDSTTKIATTAFVQNNIAAYVNGLDFKGSVRLASTADIPLTGGATLTVDGVAAANGNRILLKDNTAGAENGIYTVAGIGSTYALTRATDADISAEVTAGMFVISTEGSTNADVAWVLSTNDPITLDTTALVFIQLPSSFLAGTGLTKSGSTINFNTADTSLTVNADDVAVNLNTTGGLETSSGVRIKSDTATANTIGVTTTSNGAGTKFDSNSFADGGSETLALAAGVAGAGLALTTGVLSVNVDGSTLEINSDTLRVKDLGITTAKLAATSVTAAKLGSDVAGAGLTGGNGSAIDADPDNATVKVNGSDKLEALKHREEEFVLDGTNITNQYVDLAKAVWGTSASINSVSLYVVGGPMQRKAVDYTVSLTGGSGGVTRITFDGDLETAGAAELVATDVLVVSYDYLT